jgi:hypothetical protein
MTCVNIAFDMVALLLNFIIIILRNERGLNRSWPSMRVIMPKL